MDFILHLYLIKMKKQYDIYYAPSLAGFPRSPRVHTLLFKQYIEATCSVEMYIAHLHVL